MSKDIISKKLNLEFKSFKIGKEETLYTFDELSKMTGHSFKLIKEGINYFVKSGMMEELPNDTYFIQDALDLTSQTKGAKYQQEYRATHKKDDKCKDKSKETCQGKIERKNKTNNLELITYNSKDKVIINNDKNLIKVAGHHGKNKTHLIKIMPNTILYKIFGPTLTVNTRHKEALKKVNI